MSSSGRKSQVPSNLGSSVGAKKGGRPCLVTAGQSGGGKNGPVAACCLTHRSRRETWPRGPSALPAEGAGFSPFSWRFGVLASRQVLCLGGGLSGSVTVACPPPFPNLYPLY